MWQFLKVSRVARDCVASLAMTAIFYPFDIAAAE